MSEKKYRFFGIVRRVIPLYFKSSPLLVPIDQLLSVFHSLSWVLSIIATQRLFDNITMAGNQVIGYWQVVISLIALGFVTFGQQVLNGASNFMTDCVLEKNMGKYWGVIQRKIQRIPAVLFEDTTFLDEIEKAKMGVSFLEPFCIIFTSIFTFYGVYFFAVGAYLFWLSPILPIVLLVSFIPAFLSQIMRIKVFTKLEIENAPLRRRYEYYQKAIVDRESFKETRILGAYHYFCKLFSETLLLTTKKIWRTERKVALLQLVLNITSFIGLGISSFLLFTATMNGTITVGAFAAVFTSLNTIFGLMEELVTRHLSSMSNNVGKVANFVRLLDMEEVCGEYGEFNPSKGIVADDVSFTYPGNETVAIENVSLSISEGETIAIVGENGAGKSTLVRLLIGLYKPNSGIVKIGGLDSATTHPTSIFNRTSGIFQRYQRYKMTLADNVSISNSSSSPDNIKVQKVLDDSDFNEVSLDLETMLSPEFDGVDLSGGQWQRLAIARGLYRTSKFIILDEPTAAIDPIEETRIYNQFEKLARDKIAIIITHRLGSTKMADRIIVMDRGKIVAIGTHNELLNYSDKYTRMWTTQAEWYS